MKLKKIIAVALTMSMVFAMSSFNTFAEDICSEQPAEEQNTENLVQTAGGDWVSFETMEVLESLESETGQDYVDGELLVVYSDSDSAETGAEILTCETDGIAEAQVSNSEDTVKVTLDENASMAEQIIEISADENVVSVQPNYIYELADDYDLCETIEAISETYEEIAAMGDGTGNILGTNDPMGYSQVYFKQVGIDYWDAWDVVLKNNPQKVSVAVIDTGAVTAHEDIKDSLNTDLCVDVTMEKINGEYQKSTWDIDEDFTHGTHVSGMIGAASNNDLGIAGGASLGQTNVKDYLNLFAIGAFFWESYETPTKEGRTGKAYATTDSLSDAVNYAVENGARVINMSLGFTSVEEVWTDNIVKDAIDNAYNKNVIVVCAAGNDSSDENYYPSDYDKVISVIALETLKVDLTKMDKFEDLGLGNYRRGSFSNYNDKKDISAPGYVIVSSVNYKDKLYDQLSGTSQAAPIVTATIAMMLMVNSNLTFSQVYKIITSTATDMIYTSSYTDAKGQVIQTDVAGAGFDIYTGYGMINAKTCVSYALNPDTICLHTYYSKTTEREATCSVPGITEEVCASCNYRHVESISVAAHSLTPHAAVQKNCTTAGNSAYWECSVCGKYFSDAAGTTEIAKDSWVIPASHNLEEHEAHPATCTTAGNSAYWECKDCGKYFSDAAGTTEITKDSWVIPATNHGGTLSYYGAKAATCEAAGNCEYYYCSACKKYFIKDEQGNLIETTQEKTVIPAKGHSPVSFSAVSPTCTAAGNSAYCSCSGCHKYFSDSTCQTEIAKNSWIIPATGHTNPLAHYLAISPTCTTKGQKEFYYCSKCNKYFTDAEGTNEVNSSTLVIPATGHTMTKHEATVPTYTKDGNTEYYSCSACNKYFSDSSGKTEIEEGSWVIPKLELNLEAGTYYVRLALASDKVLDNEWGSMDSGANLQIYGKNGTTAQQFEISYDNNGYATIENVKSGKVLDVQWGNAKNSANVWQYEPNGSTAQKWKIVKNSDGSYTIKSALNENFVIDIAGAGTSNGVNAQIYSSNGTKAQKFYFDKIESDEPTLTTGENSKATADGIYTVSSALDRNKVMDIEWGSTLSGANLQIYDANGTAAQDFQIVFDNEGYAAIICKKSGKALDVQWGNACNGANVWQYDANGTKAQKWKIVENSDGTYTFKSAINEKYVLDVSWASTANGTNVQLYESNGSKAQKFYLNK